MANITRKHHKIFASSATNNGQFGSAQLGTKINSNDPDVIQALSAYDQGWNSATTGGTELPTLEEMQGLQYNNSYQIAYLLQKGIPEWNTSTDYYIGDIAREIAGTKFYKSITDNNIGNALTDINNWEFLGNFGLATTTTQGISYLNKPVTITNNATDADHDMDFGAGNFDFDDGSGQAVVSALTKQFDNTFALGANAGGMVSGESIPASGFIYVYAISTADGSLTDIIGTTTEDGSTISTDSVVSANSLNKKQYLGAIPTDASNNILAGKWYVSKDGYGFRYTKAIQDVYIIPSASTEYTRSLSVPAKENVLVIGSAHANTGTSGSDVLRINYGSPDEDLTVLTSVDLVDLASSGDSIRYARRDKPFYTSTAEMKFYVTSSSVARSFYFKTNGWEEKY